MTLSHVDPPPGSYGFDVEKIMVNIFMPKKDKHGFLFLTTESIIYHGPHISFFLYLRQITAKEVSAGLFGSPFIKLSFNVEGEDRIGTVKVNMNGQTFDKFMAAFPTVYSNSRGIRSSSPPMPQPQYSGSQISEEPSEGEECQVPAYPNAVPAYPNAVPAYPNAVPAYPGIPSNVSSMSTSRHQNSSMRANDVPPMHEITPITAPTPILEKVDSLPLMGTTVEPSPIGNNSAVEDKRFTSRGAKNANSMAWPQEAKDRVYNPAMDAKNKQDSALVSGFPVAPPTFR